jgi:hypothetical protein
MEVVGDVIDVAAIAGVGVRAIQRQAGRAGRHMAGLQPLVVPEGVSSNQ